jgi:hypothetical protein
MNNNNKTSTKCNVCNGTNLEVIFETKSMPLTGMYLSGNSKKDLPSYDQGLAYCVNCGHGQLSNVISPEILYDDTYTHRSSTSAISTTGNDFFYSYIKNIINKQKYKSILEIGCNDLYLIKKIQSLGDSIIGIDPIWKNKDHMYNESTQIIGRFIEELDNGVDFETPPDLILSSHTFEHVDNLYEQFKMLVELSSDDCLFVIEVPSFDTMIKTARFDQVFHQHLQYVSLSSMQYMIKRLGCKYLDHTFNYHYWGGTLIFAFQKTTSEEVCNKQILPSISLEDSQKVFSNFQTTLQVLYDQLILLKEPCYGFGAAQMLPILAHHMGSKLEFLEAILDDNNERTGKRLIGVDSPIVSPNQVTNLEDATVIITALDSMRPILRRLIELSPRRIINPINIY